MRSKEAFDIVVSWLTISFAFAWIFSSSPDWPFFSAVVLSIIAVGAGFIFHELAHRFVAIKFGLHAEYRMWTTGLVFAVIMALFVGFVFAAPGAVYIFGREISRKKNGLISLAGPATNIGVGLLFIALGYFAFGSFWFAIFSGAAYINFFLALFNLIPFGPLDGAKVFNWNPLVWAGFFVLSVFLTFPSLFLGFL